MPIVLITYMRSTKKRVELIMQKCKTKKELTLGRCVTYTLCDIMIIFLG